jgi:hypothetical protein
MSEAIFKLTTEEVLQLFDEQLPYLLETYPELEPRIYHAFLKAFVRKEEFVRLETELSEFREETRANFGRVDERFDRVELRLDGVESRLDGVESRLDGLHRTITSLGARWGIYNEDVIRQMIATLLQDSYGAVVERKIIDGEEFDVVISNGDHILIEITSRAKSNIQTRLERKRDIYIEKTGHTPTRIILAVGSIYSQRAQALREAGFEVVEPSEDLEDW